MGFKRHKKTFNPNRPDRGHEPDKVLIATIFTILILGLICLSSVSAVVSYSKFGDAYYYFKKQIFGAALGILGFLYFANSNYHRWRKFALAFLGISIVLLILVFIPGIAANYGTSRSWINVFGYSLQPSELVKLSFLLYLAAWIEARKDDLHDFYSGTGTFLAIFGIIAFLMLLQPDIGTLSIITSASLIMYFVGGGKLNHVLGIVLAGLLVLAILIPRSEYQLNRIKCVIDPSFSTDDKCYQINQSLIAVGSGGFWGRGLGESRQKFMYLPEVSGDSIFAIISEEMGMIFSSLLIGLFSFLFYRGFLIAQKAQDDYGKLLAIGIVSWICIQAFINIGGIINIIPMTGVPLPLVSYGGSAILAALSALGMLVNISKHTKRE